MLKFVPLYRIRAAMQRNIIPLFLCNAHAPVFVFISFTLLLCAPFFYSFQFWLHSIRINKYTKHVIKVSEMKSTTRLSVCARTQAITFGWYFFFMSVWYILFECSGKQIVSFELISMCRGKL